MSASPSTAVVERGPAVLEALRRGRPAEIVALLEVFAPAERMALRNYVNETARAISFAQHSSRAPGRTWHGAIRDGHWDAAQTALLATASLKQALRLRTFDRQVAVEYIPCLFPRDLPAFVDAFSTRYVTNPKAWDGNRGVEAMFDWAQRGLIDPPTQQGAVLILICWAPRPSLWAYLQKHPVLIRTTLPRLFKVPGVKGASAAQRDETNVTGPLGAYVIPRLIRNGHWSREEVLSWCDTALTVPRSDYEYRWFRALKERTAAAKPSR